MDGKKQRDDHAKSKCGFQCFAYSLWNEVLLNAMADQNNHDVFISYRRDGGSALAQLIYKHLESRGYRVFMDVRDLRAGHFDDSLIAKIKQATDVIILITPGSFDRCHEEQDWYRKEIETAIDLDCNVIPLRVENADLPLPEDLPESISSLSRHECVTFNSEYCDAGLDRLSKLLNTKPRRKFKGTAAALVVLVLLLVIGGALAAGMFSADNLQLGCKVVGQRLEGDDWTTFGVTDNSTMVSGGQFRILFRPTQDCYVYIVNEDATGQHALLFPNAEITQHHFCRANEPYEIPGGDQWYTLDDNIGIETMYVLASRDPLPEIENAAKLKEYAEKYQTQSRGVTIESSHKKTSTSSSSGSDVDFNLDFVEGDGSQTVQIIRIKHEAN